MGFSLLGPLCAASHLTPTRASDLRKGRPLLKVSLGYLYVFMERPCCSSTILLLLALMLLFLSFCEMVLLNENRYSKIKLMTQGPHCIKVAFFQKVWFVFQISQFQKEKYSKFLSWPWNLNLLFIVIGGKFKFQAQDRSLEYFSFWNWEVWKTNHTFWIKATFSFDLVHWQCKNWPLTCLKVLQRLSESV